MTTVYEVTEFNEGDVINGGLLVKCGGWVLHLEMAEMTAVWEALEQMHKRHIGHPDGGSYEVPADAPAVVNGRAFYNLRDAEKELEPYEVPGIDDGPFVALNGPVYVEPNYLGGSTVLATDRFPIAVGYGIPRRKDGKIDPDMPVFVTFVADEEFEDDFAPTVEVAIDFFSLYNALLGMAPPLGWYLAPFFKSDGVSVKMDWLRHLGVPVWEIEHSMVSVDYGAELEWEANYRYAEKRWPAAFRNGTFALLYSDRNDGVIEEIRDLFEFLVNDGSDAYDEETYHRLADAKEDKMWAEMKNDLRRNLVDDVLAILFAPPALWRAGVYWLQEFDEVWDSFFAILTAEMNDGRLDILWEQGEPFLYHGTENNGRWERRLDEALAWKLADDWRFRSEIGYSIVKDDAGRKAIVLWDKEGE